MDILKNYKLFLNINEAVDSDKEVGSLADVPPEVIETSKKIASDIFDRVTKPTFEYLPGKGLVMKFKVTPQDFEYIDENEPLTLDITEGARRKRTFDVTLTYLDRISESMEVQYLVSFEMIELGAGDEGFDEDDEDIQIEDDYEKPDEDEEYFDEDIADQQIKKGKIPIEDVGELDIDIDEDEI
jgi:hypothetical protein